MGMLFGFIDTILGFFLGDIFSMRIAFGSVATALVLTTPIYSTYKYIKYRAAKRKYDNKRPPASSMCGCF